MRFPQVSERVKEAPAHALRAVFASIGQVLLVTDRMKNKAAGEKQAAPPAPSASASGTASATKTADAETGTDAESGTDAETTVTEAPVEPPAAGAPTGPAATEAPIGHAATETAMAAEAAAAKPGPARTAARLPAAGPAPEAAAEAPATAAPVGEAGPPIANYGELSVASLRARLRGLTVVQVREVIAYERANANRPEVIAMFERRVAKLESPEG